jgi:hypothetical protein
VHRPRPSTRPWCSRRPTPTSQGGRGAAPCRTPAGRAANRSSWPRSSGE